MSGTVPQCNVELLSALADANAAFENRIREQVPSALEVRERGRTSTMLRPGQKGYDHCLAKFTTEVSDTRSVLILTFLYQFDRYLKEDPEIFSANYKYLFENNMDKFNSVIYHLPKIDQTTIGIILSQISETTISYKLEDLERIELVERSSLKPPYPKHVKITSQGSAVIEAALEDVRSCLSPLLTSPDAARPRMKISVESEELHRSYR